MRKVKYTFQPLKIKQNDLIMRQSKKIYRSYNVMHKNTLVINKIRINILVMRRSKKYILWSLKSTQKHPNQEVK